MRHFIAVLLSVFLPLIVSGSAMAADPAAPSPVFQAPAQDISEKPPELRVNAPAPPAAPASLPVIAPAALSPPQPSPQDVPAPALAAAVKPVAAPEKPKTMLLKTTKQIVHSPVVHHKAAPAAAKPVSAPAPVKPAPAAAQAIAQPVSQPAPQPQDKPVVADDFTVNADGSITVNKASTEMNNAAPEREEPAPVAVQAAAPAPAPAPAPITAIPVAAPVTAHIAAAAPAKKSYVRDQEEKPRSAPVKKAAHAASMKTTVMKKSTHAATVAEAPMEAARPPAFAPARASNKNLASEILPPGELPRGSSAAYNPGKPASPRVSPGPSPDSSSGPGPLDKVGGWFKRQINDLQPASTPARAFQPVAASAPIAHNNAPPAKIQQTINTNIGGYAVQAKPVNNGDLNN